MTKKPSTSIGAFFPDDARLIKKRVLGNNRDTRLPSHYGDLTIGWHYVILQGDLAPASNPLTGYTQAQAKIIFYLENNSSLDMVQPATDAITITNRSPTSSASTGDVLLVKFIIREWAPIWQSGSGSLRHGIVRSNDGCGYYTIELGTWSGNLNTSGVGIGSDTSDSSSSGIDRNCDVCYDVVGEGTDACGITLSYPVCPVTGIGEYVRAYHRASALVPLVTGSAVMLTGQGGAESSSTSDSSGAIEEVWHILDGLQEHTVQYIEVWDCCDGVDESQIETLISRQPIIFAAKVCTPISCGTCGVGSSGSTG